MEMIEIDMHVAKGMDEFTWLQAAHLCHHHAEQGVGGDIEWDAEKAVGTSLVELQRKATVSHIKLKHGVARREVHPVEVGHIPCAYDYAAGVGVMADSLYGLTDLIDESAVIIGP